MYSNRSSKQKRASAADPARVRAELQAVENSADRGSAAARTDGEAADHIPRQETERMLHEQKSARLARTAGAVGPIGRTVLLIALLALAGLMAVWMMLAT